MKRFLLRVILCLAIPLAAIIAVYLITDPYKTLKPFSLTCFDDLNRDYVSSELYLMNYQKYKYDSFIFGSSRCGGLNSYQWLHYLPEGSSQFVFQAWGETITGIEQKIVFIDRIGEKIDNALILLDIPSTFSDIQIPKEAIKIKDPAISGQSKFAFQCTLFSDFLQKPSQWVRAMKASLYKGESIVSFDSISNDWNCDNKLLDYFYPPRKDSLYNCSEISRKSFLKENFGKTDEDMPKSYNCITEDFRKQLDHIHELLVKHNTSYKVVISPAYCYTFPKISSDDYSTLVNIFGDGNVYDFSGKNDLTSDYNNFSDPNHFGQYVGWHVIRDIYDINCNSSIQ